MIDEKINYYSKQIILVSVLKEVLPEIYDNILTEFKVVDSDYDSIHDFLEVNIFD